MYNFYFGLSLQYTKSYIISGENKASVAERAQKTIQHYLSALYFLHPEKFDFFKDIKDITAFYNRKINLKDHKSPTDRIVSTDLPKYADDFKNINLEQDNKKIKKLRLQLLKKYKIGAPVRLQTTKLEFAKDSSSEKWTSEIFYIYKIKSPITSKFPFRFRIKNSKNEEILGLFLPYEIKLI